MKLVLTFALAAVLPIGFNGFAHADACKDEVVEALKFHKKHNRYHSYSETSLKGKIQSKYNMWVEGEFRIVSEVVGKPWWSMLYDEHHYNSNDGKHWSRLPGSPGWKEKAKAQTVSIYANMTETRCGETVKIEGEDYLLFEYRYKVEKPYKIDVTTTLYLDPKSRFTRRIVDVVNTPNGTSTTTILTRDDNLKIAPPE